MASTPDGNRTEGSSSVVENSSRTSLFKQARLSNFRKSLFNSPTSAPASNTESDPWVKKCNSFQVDMEVYNTVTESQQDDHKDRLEKLRQELDYIKNDAWKYKPIEELIGF